MHVGPANLQTQSQMEKYLISEHDAEMSVGYVQQGGRRSDL